MDHDLGRLGHREFEHLVQALAKQVLGPGVRVFGDGKDGGRDAAFHGPVAYTSHGGAWDGYGVVQAKYRGRSGGRPSDAAWLEGEIRKELRDWTAPGSARGALPEYLLFATNVLLSGVPGSGGIDRIDRFVGTEAARRGIRLTGWAVWHHDEICRFLDMYPGIRQSLGGFVVPGDVLAHHLMDRQKVDRESDLTELMRAQVAAGLVADRWVQLGQAGAGPDRGKIGLGPVAVDLRADRVGIVDGDRTVLAAGHVIGRGDAPLRPSVRTTGEARHVLLVGGPGQGKSTLGQLICQAYRVALLDGDDDLLPAPACEVLQSLRQDLARIGLPVPRTRRWPLRIALRDYAEALLRDARLGLLEFLVRQLKQHSPDVTEAVLVRSLRAVPWILVLDGLDEVAPRRTRETVMDRVLEFLVMACSLDADLLVVGTTRPQGYNGEFHQGDFETLELRELTREESLHYAGGLARVRHHDDPDMYDTVVKRIESAASDQDTVRLMRSPLQVTIMSLLVEKRARMPQNRYELFDAYYQTIYDREAGKPGPTGRLLAENRLHVDWLHQHVGLVLQSRVAVTEPGESLTLPEAELQVRVRRRLLEETCDPDRSRSLATELIEAATDRLVLLVAPQPGVVGFEVTSLQEYCAARALLFGPDAEIVPRLGDLATDQTWRDAWLLAVAGLFTHRQHLRADLITALRELDARDQVTMALRPGACLALDLLDEDLARQHPRHHNLLAQHAAELIGGPAGFTSSFRNVSRSLAKAAARSEQARLYLENAARIALVGRGVHTIFAFRTVALWAHLTGPLRPVARSLLSEAVLRMAPEQLAAARTLVARELPWLSLPGLSGYTPSGADGRTSLAAFLVDAPSSAARGDAEAGKIREWITNWLAGEWLSVEVVDGVPVPLVCDEYGLGLEYYGDWRWLPDVQQACVDAAAALSEAGWSVVAAFHEVLEMTFSFEVALEPVVDGIS
ncbi:NACHT domain-containing protein [Kitasatospora sp. NPDC092286]|uniref:NACHT domain-containing protein n=1 Tax=Kitasatospora sp. NPDC092286 TaxID=3364087 RepID=UPI0037F2C61F